MHRSATRLGMLAARHPRRTVAAWLAVFATVLVAAGLLGGGFADDIAAPGSESDAAFTLLEERFPAAAGGSAVAVFADPRGTVTDDRAAIESSLAGLRELPHVVAATDPFVAGTVSADGRVAFADVQFDVPDPDIGATTVEQFVEALEPARAAGLEAEAGGSAVLLNNQPETSSAEALGLLAALIVLVVAFGTVVAALVPIGLAIAAVGIGVGCVALLARVTTMSSDGPTIATMIGLGVGIDYALFILARYRENRRNGSPNGVALEGALGSAGPAVVFAGGTVVVAMGALSVTGLGVLGSMGMAASLVVLVSVAAAITLLPAVLTLLGDRVDRGALRRRIGGQREEGARWRRFAHHVSARPWRYLIASSVTLLALGLPTLDIELGFPDAGTEPVSTTHRRAYELMSEGFGAGSNGPLLVVVDLQLADETAIVDEVRQQVAADPGVAVVTEPVASPAGDTVLVGAVPTTGPADPETGVTIDRLRASLTGDGVYVAGITAAMDDVNDRLSSTLPVFVATVVLLSFLLLMLIFRSILVPLKAAVMNLLSIAGAYGIMVATFQWGWGAELLGLEGPVPVVSFVPILMFAVLFGLSMDYEVFLLSRIREEHHVTGDNAESVARGLAGTGRVITSAALIMICVFVSFLANPSPIFKMVGLGLATAVAIDATIVRMVLVPATMALMGDANWWLPRWLERRLPHLDIEAPTPVEEPVSVPVPS